MRADVPIPIDFTEHPAHGRPSVGVALHAPFVAPGGAARVAIRSWACETALGGDADTWQRLLAGGAMDAHARAPGCQAATGRATALASRVARRLAGAGLDGDPAVVVATSKGAVEDWFSPPPVRPETSTSDNPAGGLSTSGLGGIAAQLASTYRTRGPVLTLSAACASGLQALIRGAMLIRSGEVRQALIVATEASVHPLFLGSFQRLGVLADAGDGCRPFDRNRAGFYMSEAAAAVLLEAAESDGFRTPGRAHDDRRPDPRTRIFVDRFAMGGDATHLTGGDPDGRVLRHLLGRVIDGRPVDLIHAHGTGTEMNDATELAAIEASVVDQPDRPAVYSHKAALGHSLGASGLLSVVINCLCHAAAQVPPNVRTTEPLPTRRVVISRARTDRPVHRSIAIAAGFGGPVAVVSLTSNPGQETP